MPELVIEQCALLERSYSLYTGVGSIPTSLHLLKGIDMSKNPAFQFYPSDWTRDLDDHDLEIEGAWIRICCRLWWSPEKGQITKTIKEWASVLRKSKKRTIEIINIILNSDIADGEYLEDKKIATLINRRMVKDEVLRQIRIESGSMGGNPKLTKKYNKPGYVYLIKNKEKNEIKIGIAINPTARIKKINYKLKIETEMVFCFFVNDMGTMENELHLLFSTKQVKGEWFKLTPNDIELAINTLKGQDKDSVEGEERQNTRASSSSSSSSSLKDKTLLLPKKFLDNSDPVNISKFLLNQILKRKPDFKKPNIQSWAKDIDGMLRLDHRKKENIEEIILWCQQDDFWKNNILSTKKLRQQFDKLELKKNNKNTNNTEITLTKEEEDERRKILSEHF